MPDPRIAAILDRSGDAATVAWALDGQGDLAKLADPELAIAAAEAAQNSAVLLTVQQPKALRKSAAAALHRLKSRGVKVVEVAPRQASLAPEDFDLPSRAWLGMPDADGEVPLVLTASDRTGTCLMEMFLGSSDRKAQHGHANRSELRGVWKQLEGDNSLAEVPFVVGLHFASRLLGSTNDHGWKHFLAHVPAATLGVAEALDPAAYAPAAIEEGVGEDRLWMLPTRLLKKAAVDDGLNRLFTSTGEMAPDWADDLADQAVDGEARTALADAADLLKLVLTLHGRQGAAADAAKVAAQLRDGVAGKEIAPVRTSVQRAISTAGMRAMQDMMLERQQAEMEQE